MTRRIKIGYTLLALSLVALVTFAVLANTGNGEVFMYLTVVGIILVVIFCAMLGTAYKDLRTARDEDERREREINDARAMVEVVMEERVETENFIQNECRHCGSNIQSNTLKCMQCGSHSTEKKLRKGARR